MRIVRDEMGRTERRQSGFTLVELLVVIAVVGVLIAVVLPTLGMARSTAMGLVSLSRMRQVAAGWSIYAFDEDNTIVPGQPGRYADEEDNLYDVGNGKHYRPRWFASIGAKAGFFAYEVPSEDREDEHSYRVDGEVFLCPVVPEWYSTRNFPYGYNYQFLGNARFVNNEASAGFINHPVRFNEIAATAETVMFASCLGSAAGKPEGMRTPNRNDGSRDPELRALGGHGYALDPPRLPGNNDFCDRRNRAPEHRSAPDARYNGKANVAFCDGHAEAMTPGELGYEVRGDGSVASDGAEATNRWFSGDASDRDPPRLNR